MKNYIYQNEGTISIGAFMIGMLLLVLFILSTTLFFNHYYMISSYLDSIKAYYLAESGVDEGLCYCSNKIDEIVCLYLKDLKEYKRNYIQSMDENISIDYHPPILHDYICKNFIPQIKSYKKKKSNPFHNYKLTHSYETRILCKKSHESICIFVESLGIYNRSKKQIKAIVLFPQEKIIGKDLQGLPMIQIHPLEIQEYFQFYESDEKFP
ncbi:hypothetical protein [Inediibacterium massiliense]|uniref:hypothetical protein n=1 Tax=Inediibacterium massiliense TaxID=1658111 RepID=UPI0006B672EE|nr:hypothetical protein [Inediibacterium massiliense]